MLLHYTSAAPATTLPNHYRSIDTRTTSHLPKLHPDFSTPISLPQRPLDPSRSSMPTKPQRVSHPSVRVHSSTSSPKYKAEPKENQLMLEQSALLDLWGNGGVAPAGYLNTLPQRTGREHKRLSSGSSIASAGPPSPNDHSSPFVHIANYDSSLFVPLEQQDCMSTPPQSHLPKSLPTPTGTPTSSGFPASAYHNAATAQDNQRYSAVMRRIQSSNYDDDTGSFSYSGPQSVSSMSHNSPATPHTNFEHEYDEKRFAPGENMKSDMDAWMDEGLTDSSVYPPTAAYQQTVHDMFSEAAFNPQAMQNLAQQTQPNMPHTSSNLSPYRNANMTMFNERLQTANRDHLAQRNGSPVTSATRERSPYQNYGAMSGSPQDRKPTANQANMRQSHMRNSSNSVSPKELMLDDPRGDDDTSSSLFHDQFTAPEIFAQATESGFRDASAFYGDRSFANSQMGNQFPYTSNRRRQQSGSHQGNEELPDFPAHMVSMETTVEEGPSELSSSQQTSIPQPLEATQRPDDTSSDSGTYTCTYHGCTLRFDSPARLQKHKREGHRHTSPSSGPTSVDLVNIGLRNSQAGPHKCERINPSTGKPCSSIFSRPYDLTRHEDTIHNARKQKVRCHLCNEEKTFSRNDALTRHMRVVHPDVNWPGKTRRGKGRD